MPVAPSSGGGAGDDSTSLDLDPSGSSSSSRPRATSLDLPMAMRFRHLAKNAKEAVGVFASSIHGRGLYCKRVIQVKSLVLKQVSLYRNQTFKNKVKETSHSVGVW